MKAYYEISQGSEEWLAIKWAKVGGTRSAGLFIKSDNLLDEILSEKTEEFQMDYDAYTSSEMQRGIELEPHARKELSTYTGVAFKTVGWLQCEENELLGISCDGISEDETITCEIKCPQAKKHLQTIRSNEIPLDNINQCLHYFVVNPKLEKHYFCSFRPESIKPIFVKELTRESIINIGTKAKPVEVSINEAVVMAKGAALDLLKKVNEEIEKLKF